MELHFLEIGTGLLCGETFQQVVVPGQRIAINYSQSVEGFLTALFYDRKDRCCAMCRGIFLQKHPLPESTHFNALTTKVD
jgi:hypothetical protein